MNSDPNKQTQIAYDPNNVRAKVSAGVLPFGTRSAQLDRNMDDRVRSCDDDDGGVSWYQTLGFQRNTRDRAR